MKQFIFAILIIAIATPTAFAQKDAGADLEGKWVSQAEGKKTTLNFKENGKFEFDIDGDNKIDEWGGYSVSGITVTMTDDWGPEGCENTASFFYEVKHGILTFELVFDFCPSRITHFLQSFRKVEGS